MAVQIPLTTTFVPAPSCTADFYTSGIYYSIGGPSPSQCFPSGWASSSQYFSPGICPSGYVQACSVVATAGTVTETRATCCPSAYTCYKPTIFNFPGQACASVFLSQYITVVTDAVAMTTLTATLHTSTEAVNGYGVSIRYQASDFVSTTSSYSSSSSSTSTSGSSPSTSTPVSTSVALVTTTSSSSALSSTSTSSSGLSTGAKAGIGAGVAIVGMISLIGLIMFFVRRRQRALDAPVSPPEYYSKPSEQELLNNGQRSEMANYKDAQRLKKNSVHEIYTPPSELHGGR